MKRGGRVRLIFFNLLILNLNKTTLTFTGIKELPWQVKSRAEQKVWAGCVLHGLEADPARPGGALNLEVAKPHMFHRGFPRSDVLLFLTSVGCLF